MCLNSRTKRGLNFFKPTALGHLFSCANCSYIFFIYLQACPHTRGISTFIHKYVFSKIRGIGPFSFACKALPHMFLCARVSHFVIVSTLGALIHLSWLREYLQYYLYIAHICWNIYNMQNDRELKGARTFINWIDITKLNEWNCISEWRLNTKRK